MSNLLVNEFNDFFEKIELLSKQRERIESAVGALSDYLVEKYDLSTDDTFVQGSFSTNTVVRPAPSLKEEAEYDVDLVVFCASDSDSPKEALENLEEVLEENGVYKDKVEKDDPKIPCVRLRYADEDNARFHVDVLPAKRNDDGTIEVPRRNDGWETSNPAGYTEWVLELGDRFQRTIMILKRWRDESKAPIKSIVLQVMTAQHLSKAEDDAVNIVETLTAISEYLRGTTTPPEILNPALSGENLTARWKDEDFLKFKELIDEAADIAEDAIGEDSHDEAAALWQKILGEDFVFETDKEVSLEKTVAGLGDTSHAEVLRLPLVQPDGVRLDIQAFFHHPWTKTMLRKGRLIQVVVKRLKYEIKSGQNLPVGGSLDYLARVYGLKNQKYQIHWQVVNTGEDAVRANGLRGRFFPPRDSKNPKYDYEETAYEGTHWIECFVVMDNVCVARSGRFYINIHK